MFMVCHKLALMTSSKTSTQGSYSTSDRMSQWFPMNNIRLYLLIESSLLCAKRSSNGSCYCWKFLRQFAHPDAHWLQYTSRFSACGTALQGHTKSFDKKVFQFVSVCLQSSWVPALRESSCPSGTAALFFSDMWAKTLRVALQ